jgi:prephenate dehydrogenase
MDILVVGAGAMGRWIGRVFLESDVQADLLFCDTDESRARAAAEELDGEVRQPGTDGPVSVVCIAVPIPAVEEAIATYGHLASEGVFDVTGTMADPITAMAEHAPAVERASFHPLFAPENEPGNVPVVVDAGGNVTQSVVAALESRDNTVFETAAEEHDRMMETVQAKTHAAVMAFALAADDVPERYHTPISRPLTELADQVTGGDGHVYADIQSAFDGADDIAEAAARIANGDRETFLELYNESNLPADQESDR